MIVILALILIIFIGLAIFTRSISSDMLHHPMEERIAKGLWPPEQTPENYYLEYEIATTISSDGLKVTGWYLPGENGATVMIHHGTPGGRQDGLYEAAFLNEAGFNVLLGSFRAHDDCEGETITFGYYEIRDIEAWYAYLLGRDDIDPGKIGIFGESMGGGTSLLYAAKEAGVKAIATGSAFGLTQEVVKEFIKHENPKIPEWAVPVLAKFIIFWAEQLGDMDTKSLETQAVIADISPVPVLIIHGGQDDKIGGTIGRQLYEAAAEPKELLWIEEAGHVNFEKFQPELYRETLIGFFEKNLLGD